MEKIGFISRLNSYLNDRLGIGIPQVFSVLLGIFFSLFNATLGILKGSVWNGSISVYFMLLTAVRSILLFLRSTARDPDLGKIKKSILKIHIMMLVMDLYLIAPVSFMVIGKKSSSFGLIPAIAIATYTTYRITMSMIHYVRSRKQNDLKTKTFRVINLQDALVALLSLQNTLIIATGGSATSMIPLTGYTSGAIWLTIVFFTVKSFVDLKKEG